METIKKAELQIKSEWLKNLFFPGRNATGAMFYLKNMFNFTDVGKPNKSGQLEKAQGEALKNISDALLQQMKHQLEGKTLEDEIVDVTPDDRDNKEG